ncbi:MAG TPA: glycosyltransferase family 87 protein [Edaphobacter sp.]
MFARYPAHGEPSTLTSQNYYLTARLVYEHYDTSRIYEWIWLQRQKDHRDIDQRIVGMVPITPFSTLVVYPLTSMPPLAAKRCWIILNLGLLFATAFLLRALTELPLRRIALVIALNFSLRVNFLYGQYYVLLLFLLTLSCWLYVRQRRLPLEPWGQSLSQS